MKEVDSKVDALVEETRWARRVQDVLLSLRKVHRLIIREQDPKVLIEGVCSCLRESMGYYDVWMVLFERDGLTVRLRASTGFDSGFEHLARQLSAHRFPETMKRALESGKVEVVEDPSLQCRDCPLSGEYEGRAAFSKRLHYKGRTLGFMAVSLPRDYVFSGQEQELFAELCDDLARAVHDLELAKEYKDLFQHLEQAHRIIGSSPVVVFLWRNEEAWPVEFVSENCEEILGYSQRDFLEQQVRYRDIIHREDLQRVETEVYENSQELDRKSFAHEIYRVVKADGEIVFVDDRTYIIRDSKGCITHYRGVILDVSEKLLRDRMDRLLSRQRERLLLEAPDEEVLEEILEDIRTTLDLEQAEIVYLKEQDILSRDGAVLWENELSRLELSSDDDSAEGRILRECQERGFACASLVPLRSKEKVIGFLKLADKEEKRFGAELISGMLRFSESLSLAFQRRSVQEALEESEKKFRSLVETTMDWVWQCDRDGRYTYVSSNVEEIIGYRPEELLGKTPFELMEKGEAERVRGIFKERVSTLERIIALEDSLLHKDGRTRVFETNATPVFDSQGEWVGYFGTCREISERKKAEQSIKDSQMELEQVFEALPDALIYADPNRRIIRVNRSFVRIFGYERDEVLGREMNMLYAHPEDFYEQGRLRYNPDARENYDAREIEFRRKDGSIFPSETIGTPVTNTQGTLIGFLGIVRDVSDKKLQLKEQQRLQDQLTQAQKMESVGRLAGGVAHDFNNMLSVILSHAELMLEDLSEDSSSRNGLLEIQRSAKRSADLTRQLLAFARRQTVAPKVLDMNDTVEAMLKMLERLIGEDIDLHWVPGENLRPVCLDPAQIDQVLANLCINARDAIGHRVGKVTIETNLVHFDMDYCSIHQGFKEGEYVQLAVSDDGCGMDATTKGQIFEPFFTTKKMGEGTGLGLATIYGIVKQNGGFINVYSEKDEGSTFKLYFPVHSRKEEQGSHFEKEDLNPSKGSETILLVEDEAAILNISKKMLERLGYRVIAASSPKEAIEVAREHSKEIHLLMTDVVMPEMNGRELAEQLSKLFPKLKKVYMSGYTANVIAHHGVLDEGIVFIQKPFSLNDLARVLRRALSCVD